MSTRCEPRHEELVSSSCLATTSRGAEDPGQVSAGIETGSRPGRPGPDRTGGGRRPGSDPASRGRLLGGVDRLVLERDDDVDALADEHARPAPSACSGSRLRHDAARCSSPPVHPSSGERGAFSARPGHGGTWSVPTCIRPTRVTSCAAEPSSEPEQRRERPRSGRRRRAPGDARRFRSRYAELSLSVHSRTALLRS